MATSRGQRIGIWIIAAFMAVGTIGSFAIIVLANQNSASDQARYNELYAQYTQEMTAYQAKVDAQTKELSDKYYKEFSSYASRVGTFTAGDVTKLKTEDLKVGDGDEIKKDTSYAAYYIGFKPDGEIFDQSIENNALKAPLSVTNNTGLIEGWMTGVVGMKMGGVRELTIPSDQAYGAAGSGDSIPANTPLKFIVMIIPVIEKIDQPVASDELQKLYTRLNG